MVNGHTSIGFVREDGSMEVQHWPNMANTADLQSAIEKYKAASWAFEYAFPGGPWEATIHVDDVEILYRRIHVTQDVWVFKYAQGHKSAGPYFDGPPAAASAEADPSHSALAARLRSVMPGLSERVKYPCTCDEMQDKEHTVWRVIQHLNDTHHPSVACHVDEWTRERIAEWTEELPFDLTVDPERAERVRQRALKVKQRRDQGLIHMQAHSAEIIDSMKKMMESIKPTSEALQQMLGDWEGKKK